uniref:Odorant binding protein 14 n=1 Tax=Sirex nitobei TaxID=1602346 RepID=A0A857N3G3_9HYME|nr:odorant binding protein 14 [Sirex nitobei]
MQLFVAALACCALSVSALTPANRVKVIAANVRCLEESGLDPEILERTKNGEDVDDKNLDCFGACLLKDFGILNDDGTFNKDEAVKNLPDSVRNDDVINMINACSNKKGETDCDTAYLIFSCIREKAGFKYIQEEFRDI